MSTPLSPSSHRPARAAAGVAAAAALALTPGALLLTAITNPLPAQTPAPQNTGRVTGTVTGNNGQPVANAQVALVGTRFGALTDAQGRFAINGVPAGTYTARVQRIGYAPATQPVALAAGQTATLNLTVTAAATQLSTVAVVGYTTQQRRDVSDATSTVSGEEIQDQKVATVEEALRGRAPGVTINASGEPGRPAQVFIRGQNFISSEGPLYVVDGTYLRQNPNLNPNDIESIEILKDASSTAQYGAQAANGVVVIRTRRGRAGDQNRVELRTYYGTQDVPKRVDVLGAREWAAVQQQAYQNANLPVPAGVTAALNGTSTVNTNWQDAVFQQGAIQDHNLSISGGTQNASYLVSGGVLDQEGAIIETGFRRYSLRVNTDLRRGRLTLGENVAVSRSNRRGMAGFPLIDAMRLLPTIPVLDPNNASGYGYGSGANPTFGTNPVAQLQLQPREARSNQLIGSAFGEFRILEPLRYRLNLGANYENYGGSDFNSILQLRQGSPNQFADLTEVRNNFTSLLAENLLLFDPSFGGGRHRVNAVGGYTTQQINTDDITAYRRGFSDEALRTLNAGSDANASNTGTRSEAVVHSFLARVNYTLLDRYLFTGSVRRDGSSRFGANNRWGTFGAASVGWVVSAEPFFQAIPGLGRASLLKLRASTGSVGNQDIGNYRTTPTIATDRLGYSFGGQVTPGATQLSLANPDLQWQEVQTSNVGLDLGLLDDRLTLTVDGYRATTNNALVTPPLPWSLGVGLDPNRAPTVNAGSFRNTGAELGLTYRYGDRGPANAFRLNTTATFTTTRNRVLSLGNGGQPVYDVTGIARTAVGSPIGTFYVVRTAGIFQSEAEVEAHTTTIRDPNGTTRTVVIQPDAQPGDIRFVDANGDGQINDDDRVESGNGTPKASYGLFFDGGWRAFDFGLNLRGAAGFKIFNVARYWTDRGDDPSNFRAGYSPWTPTNRSTTTPRIVAAGNPNTRFNSDRWIENGDFLRLQNIVLGYRLPAAFTQRLAGGRALDSRVYLNLQNLYTITGFSNWDPETLGYGDPLGRGIDDGRIYPNVRTVSIGVDLRL